MKEHEYTNYAFRGMKDLKKRLAMKSEPTPESQWPTEEEIDNAATDFADEKLTDKEFSQNPNYHRYQGFTAAIQWLKTRSTNKK